MHRLTTERVSVKATAYIYKVSAKPGAAPDTTSWSKTVRMIDQILDYEVPCATLRERKKIPVIRPKLMLKPPNLFAQRFSFVLDSCFAGEIRSELLN